MLYLTLEQKKEFFRITQNYKKQHHMRLKEKFFLLFFVFFISALISKPLFVLADGVYQIKIFNDANENGIFDPDPKKNPGEKEGGTRNVCYDGFVPCGKELCVLDNSTLGSNTCKNKLGNCAVGTKTLFPVHCQLCHFFLMIDKIIDYVMIEIVPILAVLMIVVAGVMYYFGGLQPGLLNRAKTLIKGVVIGLAIIYSAYMIINIFLMVLGASQVNAIKDIFKDGIFSLKCPVYVPNSYMPSSATPQNF